MKNKWEYKTFWTFDELMNELNKNEYSSFNIITLEDAFCLIYKK